MQPYLHSFRILEKLQQWCGAIKTTESKSEEGHTHKRRTPRFSGQQKQCPFSQRSRVGKEYFSCNATVTAFQFLLLPWGLWGHGEKQNTHCQSLWLHPTELCVPKIRQSLPPPSTPGGNNSLSRASFTRSCEGLQRWLRELVSTGISPPSLNPPHSRQQGMQTGAMADCPSATHSTSYRTGFPFQPPPCRIPAGELQPGPFSKGVQLKQIIKSPFF